MSEPVAQPVADVSQNGCDISAVAYSNLSHPRVGLHVSQTRRTGGVEQVTAAPVADPARAYPTKASIAAAFDAWDREHAAWVAAGMQGEYPHPPAGLTSAIADRLIPRRASQHGKRWR